MTADLLLENFDVIAEAPGGVDRLRELILQMAVRGQLVPQNADDEPAANLIGDRGESRAHQEVLLPRGWIAATLSEIGEIHSGGTPSKRNSGYWGGSVPWVSPKDMKTARIRSTTDKVTELALQETSLKLVPKGSVVFVVRSGILRRHFPVALTEVATTINQDMKSLVPHRTEVAPYLALMLRGHAAIVLKQMVKQGTTVQSIVSRRLEAYSFPLPPLPEQRRIVEKVDQLMTLCDELEARQQRLGEKRNRLTRSSLHHLGAAQEAAEADRHWARFSPRIHELITAPEDVQELRKTILQLAVRGTLVPRLKPAPVVPLQELGTFVGGGTPSKGNPKLWGSDYPWVTPKDMKRDRIGGSIDMISAEALVASAVKIIPAGALLMVVRGMILVRAFPVALTEKEVTINQDMKALVLHEPDYAEYLLIVLKALRPRVLESVERSTHGTCRLSTSIIEKLAMPLPPLPEQRRIVEKVDQLMTLCDELEAKLTRSREKAERLSASIVHHMTAA